MMKERQPLCFYVDGGHRHFCDSKKDQCLLGVAMSWSIVGAILTKSLLLQVIECIVVRIQPRLQHLGDVSSRWNIFGLFIIPIQ